MLLSKHWWYGLLADVATVLSRCEHCSRVHASFTAKPEELRPIPISSMGFRWHVDTAGPLPKSAKGNKYVLVCVEAFSKYLVVVPMENDKAETTAYHFLHGVLAHFAAPGQVVTDSGTEFEGEFAKLLEDALIDHAIISADHPQANGQAEKAVHIVKRALTKMAVARHSVKQWDEDLAWLALGYRCSPQASTGHSPYELMYARPPVIPPAVKELVSTPLDISAEAAVKDLLQRKERLKQQVPIALENLAIAQHRDQRRYLQLRAPDYKPRVHRFMVGDYVYTQQLNRASKLQPRAKPLILRVLEVRDSGVLHLQGRCGRTIEVHMSHCAPCHLPDIDGGIDPLLVDNTDDVVCEVCSTSDNGAELMLCDVCNSGYHTYCLQPPLSSVPDGVWLCPECVDAGYTEQDAAGREQQRQQLQEREARPNIFPGAQMKRRDEAAHALHGRLVLKAFTDPATGKGRKYWGRIYFKDAESRPYYFRVVYEDGDSHHATMAGIKRYLQPEDAVLPPGASIPTPESLAAAVAYARQLVSRVAGGSVAVPSTRVSPADVQLLQLTVQMSLVQALVDPLTLNTQWQQVFAGRPFTVGCGPVQHGATAIIITPTAPFVLHAVFTALQMRPLVVLCYVPSLAFPADIHPLFSALKQQRRAAAFRGKNGCWLVLSRQGIDIDNWLH
jgi:hypothetical protein